MKLRKYYSGMTIIELMVAMFIAVVITMIAIPSFRVMIDKSSQRSATVEFIVSMSYARAESVRRGNDVHLRSINNNDIWSTGWCVTTEVNCDGEVIRRFDIPSGITIKSNLNTIKSFSFNSQGFLNSASSTISFCTESDDNKITITPIGQALLSNCTCDNSSVCT